MLVDRVQELEEEIRGLRQALNRVIAVGEVAEVDDVLHRVKVKLPDKDVVTGFLHVLVPYASGSYAYGLPKVGDTVLCVFMPGGIEDGFVIGSYYHKQEEPPVKDKNRFYRRFSDGTVVEYDESSGKLTVENPKDVTLKVQNSITKETQTLRISTQNLNISASSSSNLSTPTFTISGNVMIQGTLIVSGGIQSIGSLIAQGGVMTSPSGIAVFMDDLVNKFNTHTHTDSQGGSTSVPDKQLP